MNQRERRLQVGAKGGVPSANEGIRVTTISRVFANILSDKLPETRDFYTGLLGFQVAYDSDWFIYLWAPQSNLNELWNMAA